MDNIGIVVDDLPATIAFFRELGLELEGQAMIEGELFGYVKGAFTGAMNDFPGMIGEAAGSTLFLDEISDMPADLQTRFLRVLQEREYRPLGSTRVLKADFRVIAATNRPIA